MVTYRPTITFFFFFVGVSELTQDCACYKFVLKKGGAALVREAFISRSMRSNCTLLKIKKCCWWKGDITPRKYIVLIMPYILAVHTKEERKWGILHSALSVNPQRIEMQREPWLVIILCILLTLFVLWQLGFNFLCLTL